MEQFLNLIIYFTQSPPEIIYFKNTPAPPPWESNGGPLIGLYACADLFLYKGDRALQVGLCPHSIILYSCLFKQSYLELT